MVAAPSTRDPQVFGRYAVYDEIASGGMATVHLGRLAGASGFARAVAIKRLHPHFAKDPEFVSMLIDEARLAARVRHPNVVPTIDVVPEGAEILLVMEYVAGDSLANLLRAAAQRGERIPPEAAVAILVGALDGLHAAHEATSEGGKPLGIVHRDVSPQNILVGADGIARVLDFGIAKAAVRLQTTRDGQLKGKLRYMAPEQLRGEAPTRQIDIYSAAVVLWELLTSERLFAANNDAALFGMVLEGVVAPPSRLALGLPGALDDAVLRALDRRPDRRFATAHAMAVALRNAVRPASPSEVGAIVERVLGPDLGRRAARVAAIERGGAEVISALDHAPLSARTGAATETIPKGSEPITETGVRGPAVVTEAAIHANASWSNEASIPTLQMARPDRRRASPVRTAATWAIVGAALVGAAATGAVWQRAASNAPASPPISGRDPMVSASSTPVPPQPSPPIAEAPASPPADDSARAIVLDEDDPARTSPSIPSARAGAPTRGASPTSVTSATKLNCNPPYVEDATGIRRVKRECL